MHPALDKTEVRIATQLVEGALAQGFRVSVHDGCEWTIKRSTDRDAILAAMGWTDQDTLRLSEPDGTYAGMVLLVYGNGGDVIADHTADGPVGKLAEALY